ncbi:hypothetical protein AYI68_g3475, partial [Smittium mucronatum]
MTTFLLASTAVNLHLVFLIRRQIISYKRLEKIYIWSSVFVSFAISLASIIVSIRRDSCWLDTNDDLNSNKIILNQFWFLYLWILIPSFYSLVIVIMVIFKIINEQSRISKEFRNVSSPSPPIFVNTTPTSFKSSRPKSKKLELSSLSSFSHKRPKVAENTASSPIKRSLNSIDLNLLVQSSAQKSIQKPTEERMGNHSAKRNSYGDPTTIQYNKPTTYDPTTIQYNKPSSGTTGRFNLNTPVYFKSRKNAKSKTTSKKMSYSSALKIYSAILRILIYPIVPIIQTSLIIGVGLYYNLRINPDNIDAIKDFPQVNSTIYAYSGLLNVIAFCFDPAFSNKYRYLFVSSIHSDSDINAHQPMLSDSHYNPASSPHHPNPTGLGASGSP